MEIVINAGAVAAAVAVAMLIGAIWYSPRVFGRYWMSVSGVDPDDTHSAVALTVVFAAVTATGLAATTYIVWKGFGGSFLAVSVGVATVAWAAFTASRMMTHYLFENRAPGMVALNVANELVTLLGMSLVIGAWVPAGI
ncbi:hypothetical protein JOF42_000403 [Microbacterium phyllosphaerae]|uniref:DUF1761 domain-containing protein n=1 Tax=Microbacterium phyllosphaerae TaxID=124798 RepID=A0ABS4WL93_9MICO|nr:DUF1761 domain-containing protein [Microbacterium phyllosphaerae]MBP2376908.1 hypothetical protein [Microbacterium phyllosphaerae]